MTASWGTRTHGRDACQAEKFWRRHRPEPRRRSTSVHVSVRREDVGRQNTPMRSLIATGASANCWASRQKRQLMGHGVSTYYDVTAAFRGLEIRGRGWRRLGDGGKPTSSRSSPARSRWIHRRDTFRASKIMQDKACESEIEAAHQRGRPPGSGHREERSHRHRAAGYEHRCAE